MNNLEGTPRERGTPSYLVDCWHMAGWAEELDRQTSGMIARTICDVPVVLFRTSDGVVALADTCPHRFAPLSRGKLVDGAIQCGYHGLTFGPGGRCVHNPHGAIARAMQVRAFPTVEKHRAIWVWMGAPERADTALLPDFAFLNVEKESSTSQGGYLHGSANYLLYVDNIMDLSHIDFLHSDTLGGGSIVGTDQKIREDERSLTVRWSSHNLAPPPFEIRLGTVDKGVLFDRHTEVEWYPPAVVRATVTVAVPNSPPNTHNISVSAHVITPETEKTVHYFFAGTRNYRVDDVDFNRRLAEERNRILETEDGPMLAAVQERMGSTDLFSLKPLLLRTDEAAIRVRRKLASMISKQSPTAVVTGDDN